MSSHSTSTPVGDGCTFFPQGSWRHCCDVHDLAYTVGGDKIAVDIELARCVAQTGNSGIALLMLLGVLAFGWVWWLKARLKD